MVCLSVFFPCVFELEQKIGLTFLMWLAEGQYYRKQERCRPILKLWGLIFLKSLVIVFDKSIWEAFREQIRDAPWPTFPSPPPPLPTLPPQILDQSFNQAYLKVGHSNLQPTLTRPLPSRPPLRSLFLACSVFLSACLFYIFIFPSFLCLSAYQTLLKDGRLTEAFKALDIAHGQCSHYGSV